MTRSLTRPALWLALVALFVGGCGESGEDPSTRLSDAVEATFGGSFAYEFRITADRSALDAVGDEAGGIAAFLSGFALDGVVDGERSSFDLRVLGTDVLQVRDVGEDAFYLRVGLNEILGSGGAPGLDLAADIAPALEALGIDEEVRGAILAALDGAWVGVEGAFDAQSIAEALGGEAPAEGEVEGDVRQRFGEDLPAFVERFVTVEELVEEEGTTHYDVSLDLRALLRAAAELNQDLGNADTLQDLEADLSELPQRVPGRVTTRDGVITSIVFDVAEAARAAGDDLQGRFDLKLDLSDHGDVAPVEAPEGATTITGEQFTDALRRLAGFATGVGAPAG